MDESTAGRLIPTGVRTLRRSTRAGVVEQVKYVRSHRFVIKSGQTKPMRVART